MSKAVKVLIIVLLSILGVIILAAGAFILFMLWASKQPAVQPDYYEKTVTEMPLEQKYTNIGSYNVSSVVYPAGNEQIGQIKVWYPTKLESSENTYPLVVLANGTGVKASKYEAVFALRCVIYGNILRSGERPIQNISIFPDFCKKVCHY